MSQQRKRYIVGLLAFTSLLCVQNCLRAQGTTFTYQGRLQNGTNGADGRYDLTFSLWNSPIGPMQIGNSFTNLATDVSNGYFTVTVDFGDGVFDGNARWLEIGVRTNGANSFTTLSPRQLLTATPYAIYAGRVNASGINGPITSSMLAPGAAAANLAASGQAGVPSGGIVLSTNAADTNLTSTGYVLIGKVAFLEWQQDAGESSGAPSDRAEQTAIWTGTDLIVWGGETGNSSAIGTGGTYNPVTKTWKAISTNGAPSARYGHTAVWTGDEMIIWGGVNASNPYGLNDGGRYDPTTDSWTPISNSLSNTPAPRFYHTAVWTGKEMLIWGGYDGSAFNAGGRYNPATDSWTPISNNLSNTPAARFWHTAIWTGNEMIVWGGRNTIPINLNDGGRYNPTDDSWTLIPGSLSNNPTARYGHTAVWTGNEMIIWGGNEGINNPNGAALGDGSRYDPAGNVWTVLNVTNAPAPRFHHTAVWTGSEMIVWGGDSGAYGSALDNGGRYDPTADRWIPVATIGAPVARTEHAAVWADGEMIIFGGTDLINYFNDTWSYSPAQTAFLYLKQ